MIELKIQGLEALKEKMDRITPESNIKIRGVINQAALMVRATAKKLIIKPSYGRVYGKKVTFRKVTKRQASAGRKRGTAKSQKIHIASRPGDAPNTDTGELIRNIRVSAGKFSMKKGYYATVRAATPYAMRLEYGGSHLTKKGKKITIAPRPFMRPALAAHKDEIQDMVQLAIRGAIT